MAISQVTILLFVSFQPILSLGNETINTPLYLQVDMNQCHIMTEYLMRFTLIGQPALSGKAVKILRLAAFAPAMPSSADYNVRVYFVEDTQDALEVRNLRILLCLTLQ